jgi:hypothetical protein
MIVIFVLSAKTNWFHLCCFLIFSVCVHFSHASFVSMCVSIVVQHVSVFRLVLCMFPYLSVSSRICRYDEQFSVCYCFPSLFLMFFQVHICSFVLQIKHVHLYSVHMIFHCSQYVLQDWSISSPGDFIYPNTFSVIIPSPKCCIAHYHVSTPQRYWLIFEKQHKSPQHSPNSNLNCYCLILQNK